MRSLSKSFLLALSCAAAFSSSLPAAAQETGIYLGGSFGQTTLKAWCDAPPGALTACDDSDIGWKVVGGYRFHRNFAAEGTYIDWGKVSASTATRSVTAKNTSFGIAAVGILPFGERFSLFGKFGFLQTEQELALGGAPSSSGDDTEMHYGFGLKYGLTRNWGLRAEWEQTERLEGQMLSVGAEYRFSEIGSSVPAVPQPMGFYAGGSLGRSEFDGICVAGLLGCDSKDNAWKVFGGYQLNPNFAVELGYANLGQANARGSLGTASVEATAFDLVAVGMLPVANRLAAYGKLGMYRGEIEARNSLGASASDDGTEMTFGVGVRYDFTRNLAVRAEWQRYQDFSDLDITVMSIGVLLSFPRETGGPAPRGSRPKR
jgi:OOP family OmpA-OmpF porin